MTDECLPARTCDQMANASQPVDSRAWLVLAAKVAA
jgi:hypothetical protein